MGKKFLDGYVSLADGEKDPRNLVVAFAIARVILIEFDISAHVEVYFESMPFAVLHSLVVQSMFNILFCYFPITFRPPPNDKYGVTSEDLKMSLRYALACHSMTLLNITQAVFECHSCIWITCCPSILRKAYGWLTPYKGAP